MKIHQIIFLGVVILGLMVAAFFMFAPEERVYAVKAELNRLMQTPDQVCLDHYSSVLIDPKSARIIDSRKEKDLRIHVRYRAKTIFGEDVIDFIDCPLSEGYVDEIETTREKVEQLLNRE